MTSSNDEENTVEGSAEEKHGDESLKDRNAKYLLATAAFIAIIAVIAWYVMPQQQGIQDGFYNDHYFTEDAAGRWNTQVRTAQGEAQYTFYYHPEELENISYDQGINTLFRLVQETDSNITISYHPDVSRQGNAGIAGVEIAKITSQVFSIPTQSAVIENQPGENFTEVTCQSSSLNNLVIELRDGTPLRVDQTGQCVQIFAPTSRELIRGADLLVYKLLGVMQ